MASNVLFYLFAGFAIACAISMVLHRNALYSAVSLVGVFIALSCLYITLAAPFIAVVQILIYAGAVMVLVVFVIMLLNLGDEKPISRLGYLYGVGGALGAVLLAQTFFVFYAVTRTPQHNVDQSQSAGSTMSLGQAMYTEYLLPVEIVGVMLLMAIIGGVVLSRRLNQPEIEALVEQELELRNQEEEKDDYRIAF